MVATRMQVGVLALQGDVREHVKALSEIGAEPREIKLPNHLNGLRGLIIPGGESTTIGKLMAMYELLLPIRERIQSGRMAAWGTCAGLILMAKDVGGHKEPLIEVMDVHVRRNAFGSQVDSFETDLSISGLEDEPFPAVFIRSPVIEAVDNDVTILARLPENGRIVAVLQKNMLATAFHPELTSDRRLHQRFVEMCSCVPS